MNLSDFSAAHAPITGRDGQHVLVVGVKGSFDLRPDGVVRQAEAEPVIRSPIYMDDDQNQPLIRDQELTLDHEGTDIILNARAQLPDQRKTKRLRASAAIGHHTFQLLVTGNRYWEKTRGGFRKSEPDFFEKIPVSYQMAFGGVDPLDETRWDIRNPIGKGYCETKDGLEGLGLPNIESNEHPIESPELGMSTPVAGFSARPQHWSPRQTLAGTYDATWQRERMPFWPKDLKPDFFRAASPQLQLPETLLGHEQVHLQNLSPHGEILFKIPRHIPTLTVKFDGRGRGTLRPALRRVIIEPDLERMHLLWRSVIECGNDIRRIDKVIVDQRIMQRSLAKNIA